MNSLEQAQALNEIYQARQELVRQNEAEIADLKQRLKHATQKHQNLLAQRDAARRNYEEAASNIVEILDDDCDDSDPASTRQIHRNQGAQKDTSCIEQKRREKDHRTQNSVVRQRNKKAPPEVKHEVLDLVDSDDSDDEEENDYSGGLSSMNEEEKYSTLESFIGEKEANDGEAGDSESKNKRQRSSSINRIGRNEDGKIAANPSDDVVARKSASAQKRPRSSSTHSASSNTTIGSKSRRNREKSSTEPDVIHLTESETTQQAARNIEENQKSSGSGRPRSSSTGSGCHLNKATGKKRGASKSTASTRRVTHRTPPNDIPMECWLKSSIGRTREELNSIDDIVQFMGSCKFGQSVVCSKFGVVHAIVLNDEFNDLAQRNDEPQIWYVGIGPGRTREARLVGASRSTIPIFHAPKIEYSTREIFYVGHYKVVDVEELDPPIVIKQVERDMKVTFEFDRFDERLDSIIKRGPKSSNNTSGPEQDTR